MKQESRKVISKKTLGICLGLLLVTSGLIIGGKMNEDSIKDWRLETEQRIEESKKFIAELREKDDENAARFIAVESQYIAKLEYSLAQDTPFIATDFLDYLIDIFSGKSVLIILVIILSSFIVCTEYINKTIIHLITRKYKRKQILGAKLIVTLFLIVAIVLIYVLLNVILGFLFLDNKQFNDIHLYVDQSGTLVEGSKFVVLMYTIGFVFIELIIYAVMTFFLAVVSKNQTMAVTTTMLIWLLGGAVASMLSENVQQYLLTNYLEELNRYITSPLIISTKGFVKTFVPILIYCVVFVSGAFWGFEKKPM